MNHFSVSSILNRLHVDCIRASFSASSREWPISQFLATLAALVVSLSFCFQIWRKMHQREELPFPFLDLPRELRDMCYEHLLEDPYFPPKQSLLSRNSFSWMLPRGNSSQKTLPPQPKKRLELMLANRQTYHEFMDILCKRCKFTLSLSPDTYTADKKIWSISPETLERIRKCDIKLVTTSDMLGVPDPRDMVSGSWPVAAQIRHELQHLKTITELNLEVHTIGDPLWNPIWLWYHASQSFKMMGSGDDAKGPKLNKIKFTANTWSPGENYLERDEKGQWIWWCWKHRVEVASDGDMDITVREFVARLYGQCSSCRDHEDDEN